MHLFSKVPQIAFMARRQISMIVSLVLVLGSMVSLGVQGLNFGLDFSGGTLIELGYKEAVDITRTRDGLAKAGFDDAVVQHFGTARDVIVRLAPREGVSEADLSSKVIKSLENLGGEFETRRVEFVGPQVGEELTEDGGLAVVYALICIFIYVFFRFEWRFALGAVIALFHDVLITLGIFSAFQLEFDLTVLAACLAVIGYSLNDTIVVCDRIRENFRKMRKGTSMEIVDASLNQTLARTLTTSVTTLLVLIALLFFGGELIRGFSIALIIGIVVGTYSSIYVASSSALALGISKADLMPVKKEGLEGEEEGADYVP
ncbi:MAG: protein translocase subunit SecF [Gammaproteobacteria bacterium]|nr:protein translocase subunit SecF [Gammaproteobacteria bacterium]MDH5799312.1 protein translocase subunit SecF [Gammaproteobacteria bacterium]